MENLKVLKIGGGVYQDRYVLPDIHKIVKYELCDSNKVILVVSAMGHTTRDLISMLDCQTEMDIYNAAKCGESEPIFSERFCIARAHERAREKDLLMSTGENVAVALASDYLIKNGIRARGFTGGQAGIVTDDHFGDANIVDVQTYKLESFIQDNDVAVVAGFQGETRNGDITTLGFNGSDYTAFALAYYLKAPKLTLYKDVNGVYNKNPKECADAKLYKNINYQEVFNGETKGIVHEKALRLCDKMFCGKNDMEVLVRNFDLTQRQLTTISKRKTEFYR